MTRWVKPLFGLALLAVLARSVDVEQLGALARRGESSRLLLSVLLFVVALAGLQAARLHVLVRSYTGTAAGSMRLFFVGAFFNNLLPSNVGGDAVRLVYLRRMTDGDWFSPLSRLMLHRVSGIVVLLLGFLCYAPFQLNRISTLLRRLGPVPGGTGVVGLAIAALVFVAVLAGLLTGRRGAAVRARLSGFWQRLRAGLADLTGGAWLLLLVLTVAFHGVRMVGLYVAVSFFGQSVAIIDMLPVLAVTAVVALLPVTVGGLGLVEGSLSGGLSLLGVVPEAALGCAVIHRIALLIVAGVGGLVYVLDRDRFKAVGTAAS